jgi:hypothetical protein
MTRELLHSRLASATNRDQRSAHRFVLVELRHEAPRLVTGDRCLDCLALPKLAERAPLFICHDGILHFHPLLTSTPVSSAAQRG